MKYRTSKEERIDGQFDKIRYEAPNILRVGISIAHRYSVGIAYKEIRKEYCFMPLYQFIRAIKIFRNFVNYMWGNTSTFEYSKYLGGNGYLNLYDDEGVKIIKASYGNLFYFQRSFYDINRRYNSDRKYIGDCVK